MKEYFYGFQTHSLLSVWLEPSTQLGANLLVVEIGSVRNRPPKGWKTDRTFWGRSSGGLRFQKSVPTEKILEAIDKVVSNFKKVNHDHVERIAAFHMV